MDHKKYMAKAKKAIEGQASKSRLLIEDESPLLVIPSLAVTIGVNEAMVLQQIHYWLTIAAENGNNYKDGHYWTYNSIKQWHEQFPWWSIRTLKRIFYSLEKQKLLITGNYNKLPIDRTKWYRIDYEKLQSLIESPLCQNDPMDVPKWHNGCAKMTQPLPKTSPEITSESTISTGSFPTNQEKDFSCPSASPNNNNKKTPTITFKEYLKLSHNDNETIEAINNFLREYEKAFAKEHMKLRGKTWQQVADTLLYVETEYNSHDSTLTAENIEEMAQHYFTKSYQEGCNYSITHFNNAGVKAKNFYEVVYGN